MFELRAAIYLVSGSGSLLLGVMLLALKSYPDTGNRTYLTIKKYLAYTAFFDVFIDAMMLYMIYRGEAYHLLDVFALPAVYYCQLFFMSFVTLTLVKSDIDYKRYLKRAMYPLGVLTFLFCAGYMAYCFGHTGKAMELIARYCGTTLARILSATIHILLSLEILVCFIWMSISARRYILKVDNFYSGQEAENGFKVNHFLCIYFIFFVITAIDIFLTDANLDSAFMIIKAGLGILTTIFIFNMSPFFLGSGKKMAGYEMPDDGQPEDPQRSESIEEAVQRWEMSAQKPYLKEGLVLSDVADELGMNYLQLSYYLNHHLGVNFNSWINRLRIGEAKRLLAEEPQTQISDIAYRSGFSDLTIFSRNFKKEEGITASAFRKKLLQG